MQGALVAAAGRGGRRIRGRYGEGDSVLKDNAEAQRLAEVSRSFVGWGVLWHGHARA